MGLIATMSIDVLAQASYTVKYAGAYGISPDGAEAYALRADGSCVWIYGWKEGGQVKTQKKTGTWSAEEGYIRISIQGKTGIIVEEYLMKSGKFVNKAEPSRFLTLKK